MTTAQAIFSVALAVISLIIVAFAVYVLSSTAWGGRWVRAPKAGRTGGTEAK